MLSSIAKRLNIHNLQLESAVERSITEVIKKYEELKDGPLYDRENGQWKKSCWWDGTLLDKKIESSPQLMGILVESEINPERVEKSLLNLKRSSLYSTSGGLWVDKPDSPTSLSEYILVSDAQLTYVLVEQTFDPAKAERTFSQLKSMSFYDSSKKLWNMSADIDQSIHNSYRYAYTQLLGALIELRFDSQKGKETYSRLKETALFNKPKNYWNVQMDVGGAVLNTARDASTHLLEILINIEINPEKARRDFSDLKNVLYDEGQNQWYNYVESEGSVHPMLLSKNQLLGILVEIALVKKGQVPGEPAEIQLSMPKVRKF